MLDILKQTLTAYDLIPVAETNHADLHELYADCQDDFFAALLNIPAGFDLSRKHLYGLWQDGRPVAVIDLYGFDSIELGVEQSNAVSIALWEKLGFARAAAYDDNYLYRLQV